MQEFEIKLYCVQDVLGFVALATAQPFSVQVGSARHWVNGKSFMEMFALDLRIHQTVRLDVTEDEFQRFLLDVDRFLVKS